MGSYTGTTIAFSHKGGFWKTRYSYTPTCYAAVDNVMISTNKTSREDSINTERFFWEHEVNPTHNKFYETKYKSSLTLVSNQDPSAVKLFKALSLESNSKDWAGTAATNISPAGAPQNELQLGNIKGFVTKEGNQYSDLPKSLTFSNSNLDYVCQLDSIIDLSTLSTVLGDVNSSGDVTTGDLLILLGGFNSQNPNIGATSTDLNLDGTVNIQDLLLLLANFGINAAEGGEELIFDLSQPLLSLVASGWAASVLSSSLNTPLLGGGGSRAIFVNQNGESHLLSYSEFNSSWSLNLYNLESSTFGVGSTIDPYGNYAQNVSSNIWQAGSPYVYVHSYTSDGNVILGVGGNITLDLIAALINFTNNLGPEWDTIQLYSITSPDINGDPMRGQYLHLHLENDSTTPVETYAINVDFENTKLDGSKGSTQKKPKQKASPSSK